MDVDLLKSIASQLRQPTGEQGIQVAKKMNKGNLYMNRFTVEALHVKPFDRVLEIGMGNGYFVKDILRDATVRYAGCDFSEILVSEARRHNQYFVESGQADFLLANADKLPFKDASFDKAFTVNTIYFWDDPEKNLAEIRRVLKPQGCLILAVRPKSVMEHYPFVKYGFRLFSKEDLVELVSKNYFKVKTVDQKMEPDQEINGEKITAATLIVVAERI